MIIRAYLNSLLSLVKSGLIYCAAARHVDGAKKWDGKQAVDTPSSTNTSLGFQQRNETLNFGDLALRRLGTPQWLP